MKKRRLVLRASLVLVALLIASGVAFAGLKGFHVTIGGGSDKTDDDFATVSGREENAASGDSAGVAGGHDNATVDGGRGNEATAEVGTIDSGLSRDVVTITAGPTGSHDPVASGRIVNLNVTASDSQGHSLSYGWAATCPALADNGTFDDSTLPNSAWTAPDNSTGAPQDCTMKVTVYDGLGNLHTGNYLQAVLSDASDPSVITSAEVTNATQDLPYRYDVNATDAGGDPLTYSLDTAPAGMTIDAVSGLIRWTPNSSQVGEHGVTVRADLLGKLFDTQSFLITVANVDDPPTITSAEVTNATQDLPYRYDVDATDPDGGPLTYALDTAPAGMTIDAVSGLIQWTPDKGQVGDQGVTVRAEDPSQLSYTQSFAITVANVEDQPSITSTKMTNAIQDLPYRYDIVAKDPDVDPLTYSLDTAPAGMTIDAASGLIQWTPDNSQIGDHVVIVRVEDPGKLWDTEVFIVRVVNINDPPAITSAAVTTATHDVPYLYDVGATDPDNDLLIYSLDASPTGTTIDPISGLIQWTPDDSQIGYQDLTVRAEDSDKLFDTQSFTVSVTNLNGTVVAQVAASSDDAHHDTGGWPFYSDTARDIYVGAPGGGHYVLGGWRWTALGLPADATIKSAYAEFNQWGWGYEITTTLSLEDAHSPEAFSASSTPFHRWSSRTSFEVDWTWAEELPGSWTKGPSLVDGIQELIDTYGAIQEIVLLENGAGISEGRYHTWVAHDRNPSLAARIHITFERRLSTDVVATTADPSDSRNQ